MIVYQRSSSNNVLTILSLVLCPSARLHTWRLKVARVHVAVLIHSSIRLLNACRAPLCVTVQVDIPKELHFFVIGKRGEQVKEVMASTGCHIHFPDTSRSNGSGHSPPGSLASSSASSPPRDTSRDTVTITGTPACVDTARHMLRGLLPLTISFEIPDSVG